MEPENIVIGMLVLGGLGLIFAMVYDICFRCRHEWEKVVSNSNTVVYRCKKCGKEKRYTI